MAKFKYAEWSNWPWHGYARVVKLHDEYYLASATVTNEFDGGSMTMSIPFSTKMEAKKAAKKFFAMVDIELEVWE